MSNYLVMFVCTGNICRSPMAEGILKDMILDEYQEKHQVMPIEVLSAGTHAANGYPASSHAVAIAHKHGINLTFHRSRALTVQVARAAELILTMEANHTLFIKSMIPGIGTVYELKSFNQSNPGVLTDVDVRDPIGASEDVYASVFDELKREIGRVSQEIFNRALEKYRA